MKKAKDIMNTFVFTVQSKAKVNNALEIMNKYSVNYLPVKKGEKVVGMVSRHIVDRALFHHLDDYLVEEIMTDKFKVIPQNEDLDTIEQLLMDFNLRFVLVGEGTNKIEGVISRMELARQLYALRKQKAKRKEKYAESINDIPALMKKNIPSNILSILKTASQIADQYDFRVYLVGGLIRDLLLNIENKDVDIVIEGDGIAFAQKLAEKLKAQIKSHRKFGTSVVVLPDGFRLDIATARTEYYAEPASLPIVQESSLYHDLYRRDFTINALAIALNQKAYGQLIDFFGGYQDLQKGCIKALHSLSFIEDPTRAFRAVRLKHRLGFYIDERTCRLITIAIKKGMLQKLSGSRFLSELKLIFEEKNPSKALDDLAGVGLLKAIHPNLKLNKNIQNILLNLDSTNAWYISLNRKKKPQNWLLYIMALTDMLTQEEKLELSQRLSIVGNAKETIMNYKEQINHFLPDLAQRRCSQPSDIYQILHHIPLETMLYALAREKKENIVEKISQYFTDLIDVKLKITGKDIIRLGVKPGPAIGKILKQVHIAKLNGLLYNKRDEIIFARKLVD